MVAVTLSTGIAMAKSKRKHPRSGLESLKYKAGQEKQNDVRALKTEMLVSRSEKLAIKQARN